MQIRVFNTENRNFKKVSDYEEEEKIVREITRKKYERNRWIWNRNKKDTRIKNGGNIMC